LQEVPEEGCRLDEKLACQLAVAALVISELVVELIADLVEADRNHKITGPAAQPGIVSSQPPRCLASREPKI
jgi:hypothetical protein